MESDIPTWWQHLGCTSDPGAHTGEESARDEEIAELREALRKSEAENEELRQRLIDAETSLDISTNSD